MTGAVFKGANYQIELKESIKDLENQASRIEKEAMILAQERVSNMDKKADMKELKGTDRFL